MGWSVPQASQLGLGGVDEYQNVQKKHKKQEALDFCLVEAFRGVQSYFWTVLALMILIPPSQLKLACLWHTPAHKSHSD